MAREQVTSKKSKPSTDRAKRRRGPLPVPTHVFSIPSFCAAFGFSEGFFFKLVSQGRGPRLMKIGGRTFVTFAAAEEWQREREQETAASKTAAE
jgi:hypothetical protein